jgi:hypothetical protein
MFICNHGIDFTCVKQVEKLLDQDITEFKNITVDINQLLHLWVPSRLFTSFNSRFVCPILSLFVFIIRIIPKPLIDSFLLENMTLKALHPEKIWLLMKPPTIVPALFSVKCLMLMV